MKILLLLLLLPFVCASCTFVQDGETTVLALGGKGAHRNGVGTFWNNEKSFRDGALAVGAVAAGYYQAAATQAAEATAQVASKNAAVTSQKAAASAAAVEINASNNAVKMAELAAPKP